MATRLRHLIALVAWATVVFPLPARADDLPTLDLAHTKETAKAVSATVGQNGGEVVATGEDGTIYKLVIPKYALMHDTAVTLTPAVTAGGIPQEFGKFRAIIMQPDGLEFLRPARLTITPATKDADTVPRLLSFTDEGTGATPELHGLQQGAFVVAVTHFSGNAWVRAKAAVSEGLQRFIDRFKTPAKDPIEQAKVEIARELQKELGREHDCQAAGIRCVENGKERVQEAFEKTTDDWEKRVLKPLREKADFATGTCKDGRRFVQEAFGFMRQLQLIGDTKDDRFDWLGTTVTTTRTRYEQGPLTLVGELGWQATWNAITETTTETKPMGLLAQLRKKCVSEELVKCRTGGLKGGLQTSFVGEILAMEKEGQLLGDVEDDGTATGMGTVFDIMETAQDCCHQKVQTSIDDKRDYGVIRLKINFDKTQSKTIEKEYFTRTAVEQRTWTVKGSDEWVLDVDRIIDHCGPEPDMLRIEGALTRSPEASWTIDEKGTYPEGNCTNVIEEETEAKLAPGANWHSNLTYHQPKDGKIPAEIYMRRTGTEVAGKLKTQFEIRLPWSIESRMLIDYKWEQSGCFPSSRYSKDQKSLHVINKDLRKQSTVNGPFDADGGIQFKTSSTSLYRIDKKSLDPEMPDDAEVTVDVEVDLVP